MTQNKNTKNTEKDTGPGTDVETALHADIDAAIPTFAAMDDAVNFFTAKGIDLFDNETDGIKVLDILDGKGDNLSKSDLIGVPLVVLQWRFNESDKYRDGDGKNGMFVSAEIQFPVAKGTNTPLKKVPATPPGTEPTYDVRTAVLNDGGAGICADLAKITENRRAAGRPNTHAGRGVTKGLRVSRYDYTDPITGEVSEAETYYLDF